MGGLDSENDAITDTIIFQMDDRCRTEVEVSAARVNCRFDHVFADSALSHEHEISIIHRLRVGLLGCTLIVGMGNCSITFFAGILGITDQSTGKSPR